MSLRLILAIFLMHPGHVLANAWVVPVEDIQHYLTYRYYDTDTYFDLDGTERDKRGRFDKHELNYYALYGVSRSWTAGMSVVAAHQQDLQMRDVVDPVNGQRILQTTETTLQGVSDVELFGRYQLYRTNSIAIALQPTIALPPSLFVGGDGGLSGDAFEFALAGASGVNFPFLGRQHFSQLTTEYRARADGLGDQLNIHAGAGFSVAQDWDVLLDVFHTHPVGGIDNMQTTISGRNDYRLTKLQLSGLYQISDRLQVQAGWFSHLAGRNTGGGGGGLLSLWWEW